MAVGFFDRPAVRAPAPREDGTPAAGVPTSARTRAARPMRRRAAPAASNDVSPSTGGATIAGIASPSASPRRPMRKATQLTGSPGGAAFGGYRSLDERAAHKDLRMIKRMQNVGGDTSLHLGDFRKVYKTSVQEAQIRVALDSSMTERATKEVAAGARLPARSSRPTSAAARSTVDLGDGSNSHPSQFRTSVAESQLRAALRPGARESAVQAQFAGTRVMQSPRGLRTTGHVGGPTRIRNSDLAPVGEPVGLLAAAGARPASSRGRRAAHSAWTAEKLHRNTEVGGKSASLMDDAGPVSRSPRGLPVSPRRRPQPVGGANSGLDFAEDRRLTSASSGAVGSPIA